MTLHWREYAIEGALLGTFMISACVAVTSFQHPASPIRSRIGSALARRAIIGICMGLTAIGLIYSPWGQRSGAHMNPATTLTFLALGKVGVIDAALYILSQFIGGVLGLSAVRLAGRRHVAHPSVNYVVTVPGKRGPWVAWGVEFVISMGMMLMVLVMSNAEALAAYTGYAAGMLVAIFIVLAGPISGMSMNPARTLASAVIARQWRSYWVYATAPVIAMMSGAALYPVIADGQRVRCAKLCHGEGPCIFHCEIQTRTRGDDVPE